MKAYIKVIKVSLLTLIDMKTSICIISKDLTYKLKLKIKLNDNTKVILLEENGKVKVIEFISNTSIAI